MAVMENKQYGYIALFRSLMTNWIYPNHRKFTEFEAWVDMLLMANFEDKKVYFEKELILIQRGSFLTSLQKLSARWMWSVGAVRHFIGVLEKDQMVKKKSTTKCTQIFICNYDSYQKNEQTKSTPKADGKQTESIQEDTDNKVKKEKNGNKFAPPTLEEVKSYFAENGFTEESAKRAYLYYDTGSWRDSQGKKVKNWKQKMRGVWFKDENKIKSGDDFPVMYR